MGRSALIAAVFGLAVAASAASGVAGGITPGAQFKPQEARVPGSMHAIDPEIHNDEGLVVYQDQVGRVIVRELDPESAFFGGPPIIMAQGGFNLRQSYNGP